MGASELNSQAPSYLRTQKLELTAILTTVLDGSN
jgi:hypothetical protein